MTSPLPWNTTDNNNNSNVSSLLAATYACYRTMGFIIYTLVAGTLCVLGLAGNTVAYVVLGNIQGWKKPRFFGKKVFRFFRFFRFLKFFKVFWILVYKDNWTKIYDPGRTS